MQILQKLHYELSGLISWSDRGGETDLSFGGQLHFEFDLGDSFLFNWL